MSLTGAKFFSAALASAMQERGMNQVQLSKRSGIAVSRVNNYLQGKYRTIKPSHLEAICAAMGDTPAATLALVQAYAFDLLPDSFRGAVAVRVRDAKEPAGKWEVPSKGLPRDFAAALRDLYRLCVCSPKIRQRTAAWVEIMREITD